VKRITALTAEQEQLLPAIRDEWLAHGLSTEPADRTAAEDGVRAAYRAAGLQPPRFMIWLGSPWAGAVGQAIAPEIVARYVDDQVRDQVGDQVGDQVHGQVHGQVRNQVDDQVGDQVHGQVRDQVGDQVGGQVRDQVRDQVGDQVRNQVDGQVRNQVGGQVHGQVRNQVGDQVYDQVRDQVGDQVGDQVYDQVRDQVRDQVGDQVGDQVRDQVGGQVGGQVDGQVHGQVGDQVRDQRLRDWWRGRLAGQHWAGYYSYYAAMEAIGVTGLNPIHGAQQVARSAGWWWTFRDFAILTERPTQLHRDGQGRLHHETGPAIAYPDGWSIWAWHGVRVPQALIEGQWSAQDILRERNAEIRRCAIERMGWDRFVTDAGLAQVGATVPDPGNPGHYLALYDVPEQIYDEPVRVLLCDNATPERDGTRRRFGLTVPADIPDPVAAAAWTFDLDPDLYSQLTHAY
jgi:hypothetical protein